jgi:protein phosphatase
MTTTSLHLHAAAGTHPGQVYELNQDNVFAAVGDPQEGKTAGLFVVADGMGGHRAGEIASQIAVETMQRELGWLLEANDSEDTQPSLPSSAMTTAVDSAPVDDPADEPFVRRLRVAIEEANRAIAGYSEENPAAAGNMGTTITCVLVNGEQALIANVGDSRTYLMRDGELRQVTQDHSYVAKLVREGQIAPEEVFTHPRRNVITRSLGHRPGVEVDVWTETLQSGDRLLLCSDGLWEMVRDPASIADMLRAAEKPKATVEKLIDAANRNGGKDNIAVVVVHVNES